MLSIIECVLINNVYSPHFRLHSIPVPISSSPVRVELGLYDDIVTVRDQCDP